MLSTSLGVTARRSDGHDVGNFSGTIVEGVRKETRKSLREFKMRRVKVKLIFLEA